MKMSGTAWTKPNRFCRVLTAGMGFPSGSGWHRWAATSGHFQYPSVKLPKSTPAGILPPTRVLSTDFKLTVLLKKY